MLLDKYIREAYFYFRGVFMYILTKEQMYKSDRFTIDDIGIKEEILMENAGQQMTDKIVELVEKKDRIGVFCGNNNNAGDGFVVARKLKSLGYFVEIVFLGDEKKLKGAALLNFSICKNIGVTFLNFSENLNFDFVIDAMFGIGFKGEFSYPYNFAAKKINDMDSFVVSLDIPSGVYADKNIVAKDAVMADLTLVVSFLKMSCFLYPSKKHYGKISIVDANIFLDEETLNVCAKTFGEEEFKKAYIKKDEDTNKRKEGKILFVGGSDGMPGSIKMSAMAAFESGAGLIEVATTKEVKRSFYSNFPEATYTKTEEEMGCLKNFEIDKDIDVLVCGPGLCRNSFSRDVVLKAISSDLILILDADALYFLDDSLLNLIKNREKPTILTPHEGEMARLCRLPYEEIKNNRFFLSKEKAASLGVYLVLKGPNTILSTPFSKQYVNISGNQGLSKGGSGDVLSGIIASFLARSKQKNIQKAISTAIYLHGKSADILLKKGENENTITPTKLIKNLKFTF